VTITGALPQPCQLTVTTSRDAVTLTLILPPRREGIDSTWCVPQYPPIPHPEDQ
jgi:hypothetical protein